MSFTLELFGPQEIPVVLSECWRVLRERGRICVVAMSRLGKRNLMTRLYGWANQWFPRSSIAAQSWSETLSSRPGFRFAKRM